VIIHSAVSRLPPAGGCECFFLVEECQAQASGPVL
jgi:hypothetical protein